MIKFLINYFYYIELDLFSIYYLFILYLNNEYINSFIKIYLILYY